MRLYRTAFVFNSVCINWPQGRCKPNAESSLYAEVQPVLAIQVTKVTHFLQTNAKKKKKTLNRLRKFNF